MTNRRKMPPIFYDFAQHVMDIGMHLEIENTDRILLALDQLRGPGELNALKLCIDDLVAARLSDDELNAIWLATNARVKFGGDGTRWFLGDLQRLLNERISKGGKSRNVHNRNG